ncbi:DUF239-domain-containing protein [Massarina eburnea CBS 473.64]|uniref:DUF239-domain-containing protein n=1 Tax=Massarina eburnea CBS 473.64 TaxID=1395130 RepID=A0A6A6S4W4_9PLEO|nr:DUF239-domain-containing protein [Massarina eburnea CBS 473.64]
MKSHYYLCLALLHEISTAIPVDVRLTTSAPDGSVVDWIPFHSQVADGNISAAPPLPEIVLSATERNTTTPHPYSAQIGPEGTIPVLRSTGQSMTKSPPPGFQTGNDATKRGVGDHWYASSSQQVANHGGSATYSLYKAWTESGADFSLLQTAITRGNVPKPGDNSQLVGQTIEAGWINYPNQFSAPHFFIYFTTDGYSSNADYKGGWNRDVAGWVQVDTTIYPGVSFSPLSQRGGTQTDLKIQWLLHQGNWWLYVLDRWVGYYPGSLFGANTDASKSLQTEASNVFYYGEIYDSHPQLTKTDMGSGNWPETGWGNSGYIRNMVYTDTSGADKAYDGSKSVIVSDTNRYRLSPSWNSGSSWGSYFYLGGPGAGGVVDG